MDFRETEEYKLGYDGGTSQDYEAKFGKPVAGSSWHNYRRGCDQREKEQKQQKYRDLNLAEFEKKLDALCEEYNVDIDFGCGCCDAGMYCGDLEFGLTKYEA